MSQLKDKRYKLDDEQRAEILRLRKSGSTQKYLAQRFGVSEFTIRVVLDPTLKKVKYRNAWLRRNGETPVVVRGRGRLPGLPQSSVEKDARSKAIQPPKHDTRDITGRVCGDPLPGRSALDKRGQA